MTDEETVILKPRERHSGGRTQHTAQALSSDQEDVSWGRMNKGGRGTRRGQGMMGAGPAESCGLELLPSVRWEPWRAVGRAPLGRSFFRIWRMWALGLPFTRWGKRGPESPRT